MSEVEKLYSTKEIPESEETKKASDELWAVVNSIELAHEEKCTLEDLILGYATRSEKQGFIYGFQYAVSLLMSAKVVLYNE